MNKLKQLTDTQDALFIEKFPNLYAKKNPSGGYNAGIYVEEFIQSSRTALIEEIIEMGEEKLMTEKTKIDFSKEFAIETYNEKMAYNQAIDDLLLPLKEVIDKE